MWPEERQRKGKTMPHTEAIVRGVSILVALGVLALLIANPAIAGSSGSIAERVAGAALLIGAVTSAIRGFGLKGSRQYILALTHPAVSWTLVGAGILAQTLL